MEFLLCYISYTLFYCWRHQDARDGARDTIIIFYLMLSVRPYIGLLDGRRPDRVDLESYFRIFAA